MKFETGNIVVLTTSLSMYRIDMELPPGAIGKITGDCNDLMGLVGVCFYSTLTVWVNEANLEKVK